MGFFNEVVSNAKAHMSKVVEETGKLLNRGTTDTRDKRQGYQPPSAGRPSFYDVPQNSEGNPARNDPKANMDPRGTAAYAQQDAFANFAQNHPQQPQGYPGGMQQPNANAQNPAAFQYTSQNGVQGYQHTNVPQNTGAFVHTPPHQYQNKFTANQPVQGNPQPNPAANPNPGQNGNVYAFPYKDGAVVTEQGSFPMLVRIAMITSVRDCVYVLKCMEHGETVIVNAEAIRDNVTLMNRCLDMVFGAACMKKFRLELIYGQNIYLVAPQHVSVQMLEDMIQQTNAKIESLWPDARKLGVMGNPPASQSPNYGYDGRGRNAYY